MLSLKDVRREALSQSIDAKQTAELLEGLERAGWLKKITIETRGRPAHRWKINGRLFRGAESAGSAESLLVSELPSASMPLSVLAALSA
jgi:hypothetical protein